MPVSTSTMPDLSVSMASTWATKGPALVVPATGHMVQQSRWWMRAMPLMASTVSTSGAADATVAPYVQVSGPPEAAGRS